MSAAKVPCTIVTGFLGSGKTTLIKHLLATAKGRRLALIVNEFGDVGVDREILRSCGIDSCAEENIIELANGCLCCTVAEDFVPTLETLLGRALAPEHIVIETSGLALPKPLVKAFTWPAIRSRVTVDGVVAVVDGSAVAAGRFADDPAALQRQAEADGALAHDNPLEEVYSDQLLCADLVVVNKVDLIEDRQADDVVAGIARTVPAAVKILRAVEGGISADVLLGLDAAAEDDLGERPSRHDLAGDHDHDDFESFSVELPVVAEPEALVNRLRTAAEAHAILRVKGFAAVDGKPMRLLVQGVGTRFSHHYDRLWQIDERRAGRLVVIGQKGLDRSAIGAALGV